MKVYRGDVIFKLLHFPGRDDDAADGRTPQHPRERHSGRTCIVPTSYLLQRFHDAIAHFMVEWHERTRLRESRTSGSRICPTVLTCQKAAGKRAPNQNANVVVLGEGV